MKPLGAKDIPSQRSKGRPRRWQDPQFIDQVGNLDPAPSRPWALHARRHEIGVVVENLEAELVFSKGADFSQHQQVEVALVQVALQRGGDCAHDMKYHAWIAPMKPIDDGRDKTRGERTSAPDPHLACGRVGKEFDVLTPCRSSSKAAWLRSSMARPNSVSSTP